MHKIRVCGFDPSLRNWGIAVADLDLESGLLDVPTLSIVQPRDEKSKQVRKNSKDLALAKELFDGAYEVAKTCKVVFVEVPVGSQNARAMASYGVCVGVLGSLAGLGINIIEVSPEENKKVLTGNKTASKEAMIAAAMESYPNANWPRHERNGATFKKSDLKAEAEHVADAIGAIHAGCATPVFQSLLKLLRS